MNDGFELNSGGGGRTFSWGPVGTQPGAHITGVVVDMKEVQSSNYKTKELEVWDNGDPKMQTRITLRTELRDPTDPYDDGMRNVYLDGRRKPNDNGTKSKMCAVMDAVRDVTGGTMLQRSSKLTLQWVSGLGQEGDPRCFAAWYEAPAINLAGGSPPPPPGVQQPPAAPPTAPVAQPDPWAAAQANQPVQTPPPFVQTEQGPVNPATGQIQQPPVAPTPPQAPPVAPAAAAPSGPTPEAIAALKAAGVDPATVYPGYTG